MTPCPRCRMFWYRRGEVSMNILHLSAVRMLRNCPGPGFRSTFILTGHDRLESGTSSLSFLRYRPGNVVYQRGSIKHLFTSGPGRRRAWLASPHRAHSAISDESRWVGVNHSRRGRSVWDCILSLPCAQLPLLPPAPPATLKDTLGVRDNTQKLVFSEF